MKRLDDRGGMSAGAGAGERASVRHLHAWAVGRPVLLAVI